MGSLMFRDPKAAQRLPREQADAPHPGVAIHNRLQLEAAAESRCLHQVRALPRGLPGARGGRAAVAARCDPLAARICQPDAEFGAAARRRPNSTSTAKAPGQVARRRSGPAAPAWPASRSARWPSSTCPSSCRCAASWSRRARWTRSCARRCRPSTRPAIRSASPSANAPHGPRRWPFRSRMRARSRSTCSGSSATTPPSIRVTRR